MGKTYGPGVRSGEKMAEGAIDRPRQRTENPWKTWDAAAQPMKFVHSFTAPLPFDRGQAATNTSGRGKRVRKG